MCRFVMALALAALAAPAAAQEHQGHGAGGAFPPGWQGRVDRENQQVSDVRFMRMGDGFHLVTGPHVIIWNADNTASGIYRASASFTLSQVPERLEGMGLFVGGRELDQPTQDYLYFLVRHDGRYMVRHRAGGEVHTLQDWTPHDAVKPPAAAAGSTNVLAIESDENQVRFVITDQVVQTLQRAPMLNTEGIVGYRVGHHMDVHVTPIEVRPLQ